MVRNANDEDDHADHRRRAAFQDVFRRTTPVCSAPSVMRGHGASQAIVDARALARELALQRSIEAAVAAYDAQRRPATAAVVQLNRRAGPHRCQDLVEERARQGLTDLSDVVSAEELDDIEGDYKRVAGFDIDRLNNRPSLSVGSTPE
jgi:hypothetical protein